MIELSIIALIASGIALVVVFKHSHKGEYVTIEDNDDTWSELQSQKGRTHEKIEKINNNLSATIAELKTETERLRWEVENPTKHKVGGKFRKDEVITSISIVATRQNLFDIPNLPRVLYGDFGSANRAKVSFHRNITTTNIKTGKVSTWVE